VRAAGPRGREPRNAPDERDLPTLSDGARLKKGDLLRIVTPGGGGWGSPFDRPAEAVLEDVLDGFVSAESALADYGVVLTADGAGVDAAATEARRAAAERPHQDVSSRPLLRRRGRPRGRPGGVSGQMISSPSPPGSSGSAYASRRAR
jgi:hypothetical protein